MSFTTLFGPLKRGRRNVLVVAEKEASSALTPFASSLSLRSLIDTHHDQIYLPTSNRTFLGFLGPAANKGFQPRSLED
jgi:hypothetical protein